MKRYLQLLGLGFLTWLVPFVTSFFFFRGNQLMIDLATFKIIMALVLCLVTLFCLTILFRNVQPITTAFALMVGLLWLGINLVLDVLILIPMSGSSFPHYFSTIGLIYLLIPMLSVGLVSSRQRVLQT